MIVPVLSKKTGLIVPNCLRPSSPLQRPQNVSHWWNSKIMADIKSSRLNATSTLKLCTVNRPGDEMWIDVWSNLMKQQQFHKNFNHDMVIQTNARGEGTPYTGKSSDNVCIDSKCVHENVMFIIIDLSVGVNVPQGCMTCKCHGNMCIAWNDYDVLVKQISDELKSRIGFEQRCSPWVFTEHTLSYPLPKIILQTNHRGVQWVGDPWTISEIHSNQRLGNL